MSFFTPDYRLFKIYIPSQKGLLKFFWRTIAVTQDELASKRERFLVSIYPNTPKHDLPASIRKAQPGCQACLC
jgi:hypothetical protein